jgi:hypothetical protein
MDDNSSTPKSQASIELPALYQIPVNLKSISRWVNWDYRLTADDSLIKIMVSEPGPIEAAYQQCVDRQLGLGVVLTPEDPLSLIVLHSAFKPDRNALLPWAFETVENLDSYTEVSDSGTDLRIFVFSDVTDNQAKNDLEIITKGSFVSVSGNRFGTVSHVFERSFEVRELIAEYICDTWIDRVNTEGCDQVALTQLLDECLRLDQWEQRPEHTDLFEFLALCWVYPELRLQVHDRIADLRWTRERRQDFIACIEKLVPSGRGVLAKAPAPVSEPDQKAPGDTRPEVIVDWTRVTQAVDAGADAINKQPDTPLFQRGGDIVIIKTSKRKNVHDMAHDEHRLRIAPATTLYVQEVATQSATWYLPMGGGTSMQHYKPGICPKSIAQHLESRPEQFFPILTSIATTPTMRADGSVITVPGYDRSTGIYYQPSAPYPDIPDAPTLGDATAALQVLLEPMRDFEFESPHHRSAALSGILSIHCRHLCRTVPLHAVTSNTRGAGKGLLVNVFALAAIGQEAAKSSAVRDDEEMRKFLLVMARDGDRITIFDNVAGTFGTPSLERVLTEPLVKDRILGRSESTELPLQTTFYATANNLKYSGDMARRVLPIVLSPTSENPEERSDFTIKNLLKWTYDHHPELTAAALTIIKAYVIAGKPNQDLSDYGSFEDWSDLVRSMIVWLGEADPCDGRIQIELDADPEYQNLQMLLQAWKKCYPSPVRQMLRHVLPQVKAASESQAKGNPDVDENLLELGECLLAFDRRARGRVSEMSALRVGRNLPVNNGASRIVDGLQLRKETDSHTKVSWWWIDDSGHGGKPPASDDEVPF